MVLEMTKHLKHLLYLNHMAYRCFRSNRACLSTSVTRIRLILLRFVSMC